jgi:hypothetical protein
VIRPGDLHGPQHPGRRHRQGGRRPQRQRDSFEHYGEGAGQDERGIAREYGPPIAWFKDPAGNILSMIEEG